MSIVEEFDFSLESVRKRSLTKKTIEEAKIIYAMQCAILNVLTIQGWNVSPTHAHPCAREAYLIAKKAITANAVNNICVNISIDETEA
jgi:hypothetical protein